MPLKKFWKKLFNNNREVEFQALKSRSAVELSSYNRKTSRNNSNRNYLPRFYSHYDNLECAAPPLVPKQKTENNDEARFVFKKSLMDQIGDGNVCIGFCHMEAKPFSQEYLEESLNFKEDSEEVGGNTNDTSVLNEPTLNAALAVCYKFREHPQFKEGLLLKSIESQSTYPYVNYTIFDQTSNGVQTNLCLGLYRLALKNAISLKINQMNGVYEELSSMIRKSDELNNDVLRLPNSKHCGYIIVGFKLLNYEQLDAMERNWLEWTGAKDLYKCSPKAWRLKRMTFHKLLAEPDQQNSFVFVLFCEYENIMHPDHVIMGCDMVERLKQRYCGFVGLYKVHFAYSKKEQNVTSMSGSKRSVVTNWETFGEKFDKESSVISDETNDTLLLHSSSSSRGM